MPYLEAGVAVVHGRIVEGFRVPFYRDEYYETVFIPGFSDTHAHPQVIDAGLDAGIALWRDSYHWLETRRLHVDEPAVRQDLGLSTRLSELALKRAVLEGTTLIAFTGRLEANLKARLRFPWGPRMVLLPTIMDRRGWASPGDVARLYSVYRNFIGDSLLRPGVFVHSLRMVREQSFARALELATRSGMPFGLHLSEGVSEAPLLVSRLSGVSPRPRIIAVHCMSDDPRALGIRCSSCPGSNVLLYGRTRGSLAGVTSFGSDWPHLIGTVPRHLGLIARVFARRLDAILYRMTTGGYIDYGVSHTGDLAAYDVGLDKVLTGRYTPRLVLVSNTVVVAEGRIVSTGEALGDVERETLETIKYAVELYGDGVTPSIPGPEILWRLAGRLRLEPGVGLPGEVLVEGLGNGRREAG